MKGKDAINNIEFETFIRGNEKGLKFYFEKLYPSLCVFANRFLNASEISEDIVSECFFKVWCRHDMFKNESHLESYLYKAVYNQCLKTKRLKLNEKLSENYDLTGPDYFSEIIKSETLRHLYQAIEALPTQCRVVFTQLYVEGKTVRETADEMGVAVSTVKAQKARGLILLKRKLGSTMILIQYYIALQN